MEQILTKKVGNEWLAFTTKSPYIIVSADTEREAIQKAKRALQFSKTAIR